MQWVIPLQGSSTPEGVNICSQFSVNHKLSIPSSSVCESLTTTWKRTGLRMEPCRTPSVTGHKPNANAFTINIFAQPVSQLLTHHITFLLPACRLYPCSGVWAVSFQSKATPTLGSLGWCTVTSSHSVPAEQTKCQQILFFESQGPLYYLYRG